MNIKEYIETGILEAYVLGELSIEQAIEVELLSRKNEVIAKEIADIQRVSMRLISLIAHQPPKNMLSKIMAKIKQSDTNDH